MREWFFTVLPSGFIETQAQASAIRQSQNPPSGGAQAALPLHATATNRLAPENSRHLFMQETRKGTNSFSQNLSSCELISNDPDCQDALRCAAALGNVVPWAD
jgi:hypothetical protein